jgi:AcrR family transcriptional regulator
MAPNEAKVVGQYVKPYGQPEQPPVNPNSVSLNGFWGEALAESNAVLRAAKASTLERNAMNALAHRDPPHQRPYRHGDLPNAMRSAARAILDEGGPEAVGLRETARRVGVSATAAYRHFASKEDLLASVASEGFAELRGLMELAGGDRPPLVARGLAYVDFALRKRGLFRLMFGTVLIERAKYPALDEAAQATFNLLKASSEIRAGQEHPAEVGGWALVHGLASLAIEGLLPEAGARSVAETILAKAASKTAN